MYGELIKRIIKAKEERRKELVKLSIEEKIKILVEMQKIAYNIKKIREGLFGYIRLENYLFLKFILTNYP